MAEATTSKAKARPAPGAYEAPKFELPNFELPKVDLPVAFRELAEKSIVQAKETYERLKAAAEESTTVVEGTCSTAAKGLAAYNLKLIEAARANTNASFDFAAELMAAKSLSDAVEVSSAHLRKQFDLLSAQGKELTALAQKVALDTAEPIKSGVSKALNRVA